MIGYDKDAVARFRRLGYVQGLNGHYEYASANTLRNSVKQALNMDSTFDRFKPVLKGGHFSETQYNGSCFNKPVSIYNPIISLETLNLPLFFQYRKFIILLNLKKRI
jgi:hypothetical protein